MLQVMVGFVNNDISTKTAPSSLGGNRNDLGEKFSEWEGEEDLSGHVEEGGDVEDPFLLLLLQVVQDDAGHPHL